ncbi:MAG: T9SS type A sorting domain-containing protein [Muribaculaceae bacterium]|nr:T9SS type A sorting domain-containing protein [Muribaculaceae bacterium]
MRTPARTAIIILLAAASAVMPLAAAPVRVWENIELVAPDNDSPVRLEARVKDGYVYITLSRRTQVKIFTILGQTVSQAELPAGTSRLRMDGRGIYILKAGDTTVRITL